MTLKNKRGGAIALAILMPVFLAGLFSPLPASAQSPAYVNTAIALPALIPNANSPTNLATPPLIYCGRQKTLAVSFTVSAADATATTNVIFTLAPSVDGINYDTNVANEVTVVATCLGTKQITTTTNLTVNGYGYYEILTENTGYHAVITNNGASYGLKILAP